MGLPPLRKSLATDLASLSLISYSSVRLLDSELECEKNRNLLTMFEILPVNEDIF